MHGSIQPSTQPTVIGRYAIYDAIASGGMATVHLGRLVGPAGFSRTVAVKRLHPQLAQDREISQMLLEEARLAARIQHPNVVPTLDVVAAENEMLLVMEYIRGDSLSRLMRAAQAAQVRLPPNVAVAIMLNTLAGLQAAHEATDERGMPLGLVHRDVSPQNVMVGVDGVARVLDFGIAKAEGRLVTTREGEVKGKVMYMAREQLAGEHVTRAADIYAAGIILYEMLTGLRMFAGENEVAAVTRIVANDLRVPSQSDPSLAPFDMIIRRASALQPQDRYPNARDMARDLEMICAPASSTIVGEWVRRLASDRLDVRARLVAEIERSTTRSRAALAQIEEQQPTSGVVATSRQAPSASIPVQTGPMPMVPRSAPPEERSGLGPVAAIVLIVSFLLAGVGLTAIVLSRRAPKPTMTFSEPAPTPPAAEPPKTDEPAQPVEEPAPAAPAAPSSSASSSASPTPPPAPRPRTRPRCEPPYTIDAKGHKHFIPECVGQ
ncbi:MAG: serine/threonine-protein kinase [Labilithrix sp.]